MQISDVKNSLIKTLYVVTVLALIYLSFKYVLAVILPFIIAMIIAEMTRRPTDALSERTRIPRKICSFITVTFALLILLGVAFFCVYQVYAAAQGAVDKLPSVIRSVQEWASELSGFFTAFNADIPTKLSDAISEVPSALLSELMAKATSILAGTAGQLPNSFLTIAVTVIASYLVSSDYYKLRSFICETLSEKQLSKFLQTRKIIINKTVMLTKGYGILLGVTFCELTVALLVLGAQQPVTIAALTALVDILPIFGVGTVLIPWAVVELLRHNFFMGIGLVMVYLIISVLRNFIEPKIIGAQIKLSPLSVLVCMFIGYKLFGLAGLLLSPFTASIVKELIKRNVI